MRSPKKQCAVDRIVCVNNIGYPASLKLGKCYKVVPDDDLESDEIRVVDESGEDYVYPAGRFSAESGFRLVSSDSESR